KIGTVAGTSAFESPAFDYTLESLTDTDTGHINDIASGKYVGSNKITHSVVIGIFEPELFEVTEYTFSGRLRMTNCRLYSPGCVLLRKTKLERSISVPIQALLLKNYTRSGFYNCHRNTTAVVGKYLRHPYFSAY